MRVWCPLLLLGALVLTGCRSRPTTNPIANGPATAALAPGWSTPPPGHRTWAGADETVAGDEAPAEEESFWSKLKDPDDGMLDVSRLIDEGKGFIPILLPVAEPAVGYGLAGAILYIHPRPESEEKKPKDDNVRVPPSMSFAGGLATNNGTWGAALGHMGVWDEGRWRFFGAVVTADANLTFYEPGNTNPSGTKWNSEVNGVYASLKRAVSKRWYVGGSYFYAGLNNTIDIPGGPPFPPQQLDSDLAGVGVSLTYDSRDNIFTPNQGLYGDVTSSFHGQSVGSDFNYTRVNLKGYSWWDLDPVVLGARLEGGGAGDDAPFYGLPFLVMRGVPAFRYVGFYSVVAELEPRWKLDERWSLLAFGSAGRVALNAGDLGSADTVFAGGGGFRYLIAKEEGLAMGIDYAVGPEQSAIYFIIGSYWVGL